MKILLGSQSLRRQELLKQAGYDFEVITANVDEENHKGLKPRQYVMDVARRKLMALLPQDQDAFVICADTIVVLGKTILGKPSTVEEAYKMISLLSGKKHKVLTAVAVAYQGNFYTILSKATVKVRQMSKEDIDQYVLTDEPYDKAGGYAIQGYFARYIADLKGDFYTVMGLPLFKVTQLLEQLDK